MPQRVHIANAIFWEDAKGQLPAAGTVISEENVRQGQWRPRPRYLQVKPAGHLAVSHSLCLSVSRFLSILSHTHTHKRTHNLTHSH